jgi:hypothetical protein
MSNRFRMPQMWSDLKNHKRNVMPFKLSEIIQRKRTFKFRLDSKHLESTRCPVKPGLRRVLQMTDVIIHLFIFIFNKICHLTPFSIESLFGRVTNNRNFCSDQSIEMEMMLQSDARRNFRSGRMINHKCQTNVWERMNGKSASSALARARQIVMIWMLVLPQIRHLQLIFGHGNVIRCEFEVKSKSLKQNARQVFEFANNTIIWHVYIKSDREWRISQRERDRYGWKDKLTTKIHNLPRWKLGGILI